MNYLDFSSLLDGEPALLALFSTFQFDPDFFERRLLKSETLRKARRIAVFMDARQWHLLIQRDVPSRWINRRYLVVPVHRSPGVFHPKLNLLLTETGGSVLCGSNNLTRSGCASNLELLNSLPFEFDGDSVPQKQLARQTLSFFRRASEDTDEQVGRIARAWIDEVEKAFPWPEPTQKIDDLNTRLIHTYSGPIWEQIAEAVNTSQPQQFFIVSPFHDADGAICRELIKKWPNAKVELLVQQGYTTLPVSPLRKLPSFRLSEIQDSSRRVHAKLFAWKGNVLSGCVVGSANFTTAAFHGRNVETALLLSEAWPLVEKLFDSTVKKRPLSLENFEPGTEEAPESEEWTPPLLSVSSAVLVEVDHLIVNFQSRLDEHPDSFRVTIRAPGEQNPRVSIPIPRTSQGKERVRIPEGKLTDIHGTLLVSIVAEVGDERFESPAIWLIQEDRLTHEPNGGSSSSRGKVEETGEGLLEYLDEIGSRDGIAAVAELLRQLDIRFYDGSSGGRSLTSFTVRISNPFESDRIPDWLIQVKGDAADLGEPLLDFVDRHEKRKLRKHVCRGNINGIGNFLDILTTLVRLLYIYYKRGVVKRLVASSRLCDWIELTTSGRDESFDGYLYSLWNSLGGDVTLLQKVCGKSHYCAEVRSILLIAQKLRYVPGESPRYEKPPLSQKDVLVDRSAAVAEAFAECELAEPDRAEVQSALERYRMFSAEEIARMLAAL